MKNISTFLLLILLSYTSFGQVMNIADAKVLPTSTVVTVKGIVTNGPELGVIRYMQDNTGGIGIYDFAVMEDVQRGDSIIVTGPLAPYNNLQEIAPVSSLTVIGSGYPLPDPVEVSIEEGFSEPYEGQLVSFPNITFVDMGSFATTSTNYDITDGATTAEVRINGTTNITGTLIPDSEINLTGIMSQFSSSSPSSGYQLLPRDLFDISAPGNPPVISTRLIQSNLTTTSFTVSFETLNEGNTILYYGLTESLGSLVSDEAQVTGHSINLTGLSSGTVYYVQGASVSATNDTSYSPIAAMATVSNSSGDIKVYFNNPVDNSVATVENASFLNQTFDDTLIAYIDRAQFSIDMTIYNIDNDLGLITALNDAYVRGVNVRVIADADVNTAAYNALSIGPGNKIKAPPGSSESFGLMHNKFIIFDVISSDANDPIVWTGSTNFTSGQMLSDYNNVITVQDQSLARAYLVEFNEMWNGDFREEKRDNTPHEFLIGGERVELYFSPSDEVEERIKEEIRTADHDLYLSMFSYTRFSISFEIADAVEGGAFAAAIIDDINTSNLEYTVLDDALGETLFLHTGPGIYHHKYLIIDPNCENSDPMILTGSANYSSNGTARSDENILIIHDPIVANLYYQEFNQRYKDKGGDIFQTPNPVACDIASSIDQLPLSSEWRMYPNPASERVYLNVPENVTGRTDISLMDMLGRVHVSFSAWPGQGEELSIDLSGLNTGLYLINIRENGRSSSLPLIVE